MRVGPFLGAEVGFDLIFTNNYMPGLTGPELVARVRQNFPSDLRSRNLPDPGQRTRVSDHSP